ncbi:bifunctional tetrahydrofolate synthase/dihydrofolate synthase [Parahaliea mediterranea]|uniref:Dihydrofolate synthase/folylpolyglutamate synthase n=1 Tax=Parahaliea mediterranea TaxID=651086 RepID=A0A939DIW8_9GAMM|nr:bifunctional tetrahydrofolate synthase/dihydrofolate synthase [Parahaliea mediterranea]MBN7798671.1 bifunctional tetrahydrofolate synthase/dihydrofolate synthase [Parahaliea mediterranea]
MSDTGLAAWLQRLEALHPTEIELGLTRVRAVAQRLELLPVAVPTVTIAGTNGKGSTAAALEALLLAAGRRPGVYTSPHLLRYNERIRVAGVEADDTDIVRAFEQIDAARGEISLTYFEFATLAALWIFRARGADVLVLEVGLGGRLDAVNIVDASVAVITSIALDHQGWLGDTRDAIAREKAGILRRDRPAVIAEPEPPAALGEAVADSGARGLFLGRDFHCAVDGGHWRARLRAAGKRGGEFVLPPVPVGGVVPANLCAALQALVLLGESPAELDLLAVLGDVRPPGRRQRRRVAGRDYLLDVAHNPQSVDMLLEYLSLSPCQGRTIALFSAMEDKDIRAMIRPATGVFDAWFLADQPDNPRAAKAADIAAMLREAGESMISVSRNPRQALRRAQSIMAGEDRLVVFGSFFTVAAVLPALDRELDRGKR